jgi:hypothetical protein
MNDITGVELRDAGIALVTENSAEDFKERICIAFHYWLRTAPSEFLIEDFRIWWRHNGGEDAHSPNFWGAFTRLPGVSPLIETTGEARRPVAKASHARIVLVWRRK